MDQNATNGLEIAIVGLAGRFPGARNIDEFWHNISTGQESITFFTEEELRAEGIDVELLRQPNYVKAHGVLEDADLFDADFFKFLPREAEITDPQQRLFLECAWEALENAGYADETQRRRVGVFAGSSLNTYLLHYLSEIRSMTSQHQLVLSNDKDFIATRVAYKLNLRGPALSIQTACSTSLVAVHMACQSLLNGECDLALAGAASLTVPRKSGYLYQEGGIQAPDGHCRAFDARAEGTVGGNGVGIVVLKRLEEALEARDTIHAIIKGSAINNDGGLKVGFTAPDASGQARVIQDALAIAEVQTESISYVEAHGTGTPLGDPIEIQGLVQAFTTQTSKKGFCALGSVKTNIGHLDAAAGIAGLIKTVLMLKHRQIPPSLHFERPNPQIDFAATPFYVNTQLRPWEAATHPRRAGVSSFGMGGTNAHVVLEESPPLAPSSPHRPWQLLLVSAKIAKSLDTTIEKLAEYLQQHREIDLADAAYTLHVGRADFQQRKMLVCRYDPGDAASLLHAADQGTRALAEIENPPVMFLFPGQGTQHCDMGKELYQNEPTFRAHIDTCAEVLAPFLESDLRKTLYPSEEERAEAERRLHTTAFAQPALFAFEYALAQLWLEWGICPQAMLGHSIGEYVAACLAGVFTLQDALRLTARRGQLMQSLLPGSMLSVPMSEHELLPLLDRQLALAAVNAPSSCVVAGPPEQIEALHEQLRIRNLRCRYLATSHAFHSAMMEPIVEPFVEEVRQVPLHTPALPFLSNVSGTWITEQEATDPSYWGLHVRQTVRFQAGLQSLIKIPEALLLEVGPGQTLAMLARQQLAPSRVLASLPHSRDASSQHAHLLTTLGKLWLGGVSINWPGFYMHEHRRRISLPTSAFERKRYWITTTTTQVRSNSPFVTEELPQQTSSQRTQTLSRQERLERVCMLPSARNNETHADEHNTIWHRKDTSIMLDQKNMASSRQSKLLVQLKDITEKLSGIPAEQITDETSFLEIDLDSLLLLQFNQAVQDTFGIQLALRLLFEEYTTFASLATYLDQTLPSEAPVEVATVRETHALPETINPSLPREALPSPTIQPLTFTPAPQTVGNSIRSEEQRQGNALERIVETQLLLMARQLEVLKGSQTEGTGNNHVSHQSTPQIPSPPLAAQPVPAIPHQPLSVSSSAPTRDPYIPYQPAQAYTGTRLTPLQQAYLSAFTEHFVQRTQGSKRLTQQYRPVLADPIASTGYRQLYKELTYPIFAIRSAGSKIWDVDGHEYIDIAMGFGVHLFGHAPHFVTEAITKQLQEGIPIGTQIPLVGEVAQLACELTGMERVMFANSGTEAVMVALRIARTASKRNKIVMFAGSYHGTYEGVLARMIEEQGEWRTKPVAPGIPPSMVEDMIVLPYDDPRSLDIIEQRADELAAVLVEPVQSRRPELQPKAFLHALREVTRRHRIILIFDEVITGFRIHQGGAQAWFGVQADMATYSKVIGGGLPFSMVAGKRSIMDALDGGMWQYGDTSYPAQEKTQFGGAFFKHPLSLATAQAVFTHLKAEGPALQQRLNDLTNYLASSLNSFFEEQQVPIRMVSFGSLFGFAFQGDQIFSDLFFYHLNAKGIYTWRGRTCFLSTAHSQADVNEIIRVVKESVRDMQRGGFLPSPPDTPTPSGEEQQNQQTFIEEAGSGITRFPLSDIQLQAWIATQIESDASRAYNESQTLRLRGPLNLAAMRQALQNLVNRHDALRTTFSPLGDYQYIAASRTLDVPLHDFSDLTAQERTRQVETWITHKANQSFDLEHGPLFCADVLKLEEQEHLLILTVHHLVVDAQSSEVILKELSLLYTAACQGQADPLPPAMQYSQYTQWLATQKESDQMVKAEAYWLAQYADSLPVVELPTNWLRPHTKTYHGTREGLAFDLELTNKLKRLSRQRGSTLFITLLASFQVLLHQLSGQDDLVVGVPANGQVLVNAKDLIGYCINVLPIRSRLAGDPTFAHYLTEVRKQMLDGYDHQIYPLGNLLQKLHPKRSTDRLPLIMVTFNIEHTESLPGFQDLQVEALLNPTNFSKYDMGITIRESEGNLSLSCNYNTDLFSASTIQQWMHLYEALLHLVVAHPEHKISELKQYIKEEAYSYSRKAEASNSNPGIEGSSVEYPDNLCFHQLFEAQVARTPEATAVVCEDVQLSYQELNHRANQLAHHLRELGIGPEIPVAMCVERSPAMIVSLLAILKAGGAFLALDPAYPKARLSYMLEDAHTPVLLIDQTLLARLVVPSHIQVVCIDADWSTIAQQPAENLAVEMDAQNLAYLVYTSGSTGQPKGVMIEHRSLVNYLHWVTTYLLDDTIRHLPMLTELTFDASLKQILAPLLQGKAVWVVSREAISQPATLIQEIGGRTQTGLNCVPSLWATILDTLEFDHLIAASGSISHLFLGGEQISDELIRRSITALPHVQIYNLYGPSEATANASVARVTAGDEVSIGRPIANTQIYVLDRHLHPVPIGMPGELYIGGVSLARGYLHRPELTSERFIPNPFSSDRGARLYRTGDRGRYRTDGMIEFLGRVDQQVKIRGYRIELDEIQAILQQQPALKECVVITREDSAGDRQLVAYVVLRQGMSASSSEMRSYLQDRLPAYMIPSSFISLEALPLTPNGKLDRQALAALTQNRLVADSAFVPPQTAVEKQLAALWCDLLGLERVGIHDDFFDDGGHSLLAIRLRFRIQAAFGVDIPLSHFFETTTIHKLATTIERMQENRSQFSPQTSIQPADRQLRRRKVSVRAQRKAE